MQRQIDWRYVVRMGVLAGVGTFFVSIVGMVEEFTKREVIADVVTLGQLLIFIAPVVLAFVTADKVDKKGGGPIGALLSGLAVGILSPILPAILILLPSLFENIRDMFVNISPALVEILTFGQPSLGSGIALLFGLTVAATLLATVLVLVPDRVRGIILTGLYWTIGIGVMSELLRQMFQQFEEYGWLTRDQIRWLLAGGTIRLRFAIIIFVTSVVANVLSPVVRRPMQERLESAPPSTQRTVNIVRTALLLALFIALPWLVGRFLSDVLVTVGLYVLMGLGLNIAVGRAGLLDLGYLTNFAVGAYLTAVLTSTGPLGFATRTGNEFFNFWWLIPISIAAAMLTGFFFALPVLRMRGDYLAIATLGFGEIIGKLAVSDWLKPYIGGAQGILFIPKPVFFGIELTNPEQLYYVVFAACLLMLFVSMRLSDSRTGRQWMALREDEDVAAAMGVDTTRTKVIAFTLSAAAGGLAGALFASKVGTVFPNSFTILVSINVLSLIIVGGMGSIPGVVVGAAALVGLPELLREFSEFRFLLFGALLVVMMLVKPEGLWPSAAIQRELAADEEAAAAAAD